MSTTSDPPTGMIRETADAVSLTWIANDPLARNWADDSEAFTVAFTVPASPSDDRINAPPPVSVRIGWSRR